jgi:hypothetical protein
VGFLGSPPLLLSSLHSETLYWAVRIIKCQALVNFMMLAVFFLAEWDEHIAEAAHIGDGPKGNG